ncbi:hypothetical protein H2198_002398 [Neophaeococcomyces mojaviensis]|uniref:Uncharacterized protein n=1 Tax=Neophaeococcomyces mojaviensis TaxID=3383035 RepID=A0ACC3AE52_9EURO|nr:hypothetical protein H2198_002398 [Knufia sp. JES_112]
MPSSEAPQKSKRFELPTLSGGRPRLTTTPSHLLPATALFHGPHSRNASRNSLNYPQTPADDKPQRLPRATPPTASFSVPRTSHVSEKSYGPTQQARADVIRGGGGGKKEDDFRADAVWAEMQKTLADVELSAMSSSHVFSSTHAKALEDLRNAQLGLAQAWAKSEADEMVDEEFGNEAPEQSAVGTMKRGMFSGGSPASAQGRRSRQGSSSSVSGRNLEEETERDIRLARQRREANDRYFQQVNRGVLDVVSKLDEVANAMRRVEKESREIWNDSSGSEDMGDVTEIDASRSAGVLGESAVDTDTDVLVDSPVESKRR